MREKRTAREREANDYISIIEQLADRDLINANSVALVCHVSYCEAVMFSS